MVTRNSSFKVTKVLEKPNQILIGKISSLYLSSKTVFARCRVCLWPAFLLFLCKIRMGTFSINLWSAVGFCLTQSRLRTLETQLPFLERGYFVELHVGSYSLVPKIGKQQEDFLECGFSCA